jgi:putative aldouronate transport system substrate-binding protein
MKKLIAIMLAMMTIVGICGAFAGCGPTGQPPIKEGQIVIGIPDDLKIEDFETNALTLWLEEQTGYDLTFKKYASSPSDYKTQLSVQVLDPAVTLPHILLHMDLGEAAWQEYGDEGYFIDVKDLLMDKEGKSKNFWEMAEYFDATAVTTAIERCSSDDRTKIYALPTMEKSMVDPIPFLAHINQDWLKQIGRENNPPKTLDELYEVLKLFKQHCCKGQGYWPLLSGNASEIGGDGVWWLIAQFCPQYSYDNYFGLSADGKTLTTPFTSEEFRQGLIFVRKLMAEGLMPDNSLSMSHTDVKAIVNNEKGTRVGVLIGHATPVFNDKNNKNLNAYVPLDLYPSNQQAGFGYGKAGAFITEQAEIEGKVDACWEVLMQLYTKEGSIRCRYGDEGVNWTWVEEGDDVKSYLGLDCWIYLLDDPFSQPNNEMWGTPGPTLNPQAEGEFVAQEEMSEWLKYRYDLNGAAYRNFYKAQENNGYMIPDIVLTMTEDNQIKYKRQNTQNEFRSWLAKFVKDANTDPANPTTWNQYLTALNEKGLQDWLAIYQNAYTARYMESVLNSK